jgi:hypothetical protein
LSVVRARGVWDDLTGGPDGGTVGPGGFGCSCVGAGDVVALGPSSRFVHGQDCAAGEGVYSVEAAAAIVGLALGLWADTAAQLGEGVEDGRE